MAFAERTEIASTRSRAYGLLTMTGALSQSVRDQGTEPLSTDADSTNIKL